MKRSGTTHHAPLIALLIAGSLLLSYRDVTPGNEGMALVKAGTLYTTDPISHAPKHVAIKSFLLDKNLVTVAEFEAFVKATGYKTEAEKFGNGGVFDAKA